MTTTLPSISIDRWINMAKTTSVVVRNRKPFPHCDVSLSLSIPLTLLFSYLCVFSNRFLNHFSIVWSIFPFCSSVFIRIFSYLVRLSNSSMILSFSCLHYIKTEPLFCARQSSLHIHNCKLPEFLFSFVPLLSLKIVFIDRTSK